MSLPRPISTTGFKAGVIFANKKKWLDEALEHRRLGYDVQPFILDTIKKGEIDITNKAWTLHRPSALKYKNKHFTSWDHLANADIQNHVSVDANKNEVMAEINRLVMIGAIGVYGGSKRNRNFLIPF